MAIDTIKSFPVLPIRPVRGKGDEEKQQKKEQKKNEGSDKKNRFQSELDEGRIDDYA